MATTAPRDGSDTTVAPAVVGGPGRHARPVSVGAVIGYSVITFGIYGMVEFYRVATSYADLAPARRTRFATWFWTYVGAMLAATIALSFDDDLIRAAGVLLAIVTLVSGAMTLAAVIRTRLAVAQRFGVDPDLASLGLHQALWIVGFVLSGALVGLLLLMLQAYLFFCDHNLLCDALEGASATGTGTGPL